MRFPEFTEEWEAKKLGEIIVEGKLGGNYENSESYKGFPVIKMGNLGRGEIVLDKIQYLSQNEKYNEDDVLKAGDLLFNTRNTLELVGKVAIWRNELPFALYNSNLMRIKVNNLLEPSNRFLNLYFNTNGAINQLRSFATGTTSVAAIYSRDLAAFTVIFPSVQEQIKIASFLSLIDERITTQNKIIENLKTQMLGFQEKIFRQKIKLKDNNGKSFPSWSFKKGGELFESISNKNHYSDLPILAITQDKGAVPRDLIDYQITVTERSIESYKVVEIGDFIISLRSFQGGIEHSDYTGICSPAYIILRNKIEITQHFYKYYFKTPDYIRLLNRKLEGIRDGKMISYSYFAEIELPFPIIEEQQKIASFLSKVDQKIHTEKAILEWLENQKKYLLKQMFV